MLEKPRELDEPKNCPICDSPAARRVAVESNPPVKYGCFNYECQMSAVSCSLEDWNRRPAEVMVEEMLYRALIFITARGLKMPGQEACRVHLHNLGWDDA